MKKLLYKGIEFDDFYLYRETENSSQCEYKYPHTAQAVDGFEEADVYICPHCIKKYGLYEETETTAEEIENIIQNELEGEYDDITCGVKGCYNKNSFDGWLNISECSLAKNNDKRVVSEFITEADKLLYGRSF